MLSRLTRTLRILRSAAILAALAATAPPARATMPPSSGPIPPEVTSAFADHMFAVPEPVDGLSASASHNEWRVPVILAAYDGNPLQFDAGDFAHDVFDTTGSTATGSLYDYWMWVSGNRVRVVAEVVATITLPNSRYFYSRGARGLDRNSTPRNSFGAIRDALMLSQTTVDWNLYDLDRDGYVDMVWLVHAGPGSEASGDPDDLWSITSDMNSPWRLGEAFETSTLIPGTQRKVRINRFTILPELSGRRAGAISEIGVYCHEFGHAMGLPDLYDTSGGSNAGPGNWALMATGGFGSNGVSPEFPSHLGAWSLRFLGLDRTTRPTVDTIFDLPPVAANGDIVDLWFQGEESPEHFLLENRVRDVFDRTLPNQGLIVCQVNEAVMGARIANNNVNAGLNPAMVLIEGDGDHDLVVGRNRGDGSDPFPGSLQKVELNDQTVPSLRSIDGYPTQIALSDIRRVDPLLHFVARVRAAGWRPIADLTPPAFQPLAAAGPARTAVYSEGALEIVRSEMRADRPQIVLHRMFDSALETMVLSNSTRAAVSPSIAALPGGDLVVVWSDTREGRSRLWIRTRIRDTWTPERKLVELDGNCISPALAVDGRGVLICAFQHARDTSTEIRSLRFTYLSPYAETRILSATGAAPGSPGVAATRGGIAYVVWVERSSGTSRLTFVRQHPDSLWSAPEPLTPAPRFAQASFSLETDGAGTLHTVWQTSGPGDYQLHYQRRSETQRPVPSDTTLESGEVSPQNPTIAVAPDGGIHVGFESPHGTVSQIRYKRWSPGGGWDYRSTEVTEATFGYASQPMLAAPDPTRVIVAFVGESPTGPKLYRRLREIGSAPAPAPARAELPPTLLRAGPNPLPRGRALELAWEGAPPVEPVLDLFDVSGRRLTSVNLAAAGDRWTAEVPPGTMSAWPPGLYFARVRSGRSAAAKWMLLR